MATGHSTKVVGQTGEYLVAAELSRRRLIATTFTGNVPHYDIISSDETGQHVSVQVKASSGSTWQFGNISLYCDIKFNSKNQQIVGKNKPCPINRLVMVFVKIGSDRQDRFYILTWDQLRDLLVANHKAYLDKHDGIRPKKWDSLHCALKESDLTPFRDKWETVFENLK